MQNKRRHKRFKVDVLELGGKMSLADTVEIINISLGGIALNADRRLDIGREYVIKLGDKQKAIDIKGTVVRSELIGFKVNKTGEQVPFYSAGFMFKDGQEKKITEFLQIIEQHIQKEEVPASGERRLGVRFQIVTPQEKVLNFPEQFRVKVISLSGMLIQTEQLLSIESSIPMELSLSADKSVNFIGRVASCQMAEEKERTRYEIGVEFTEVKDRTLLERFIDYVTKKGS
ncbi:MAG TPA: PilZ domain-containing protein [Nitrospirota bacterium]